MDYEEKRRRQRIRVIVAEAGMVISIIAIVVVAVLASMGFFISGDGQIEQSGLVQIHSLPTGATTELDGVTLFSRTNLSKTLPTGEHRIKLSRDGYDSWEKTITVYPGLLMRLYYPRLFLQNRTPEEVLTLNQADSRVGLEFYSAARSREYALYALEDAAEWHLLDLRGDTVKDTVLNLAAVLPGMVETSPGSDTGTREKSEAAKKYKFAGSIEELQWSANSEKILVKVTYEDKKSWILVNLREVAKSLNLTETFGLNLERIGIIDGSANQLYVLENHHLRQINTGNSSISKVLLNNVASFSNSGSSVVYVTQPEDVDGIPMRSIGTYRDGEDNSVIITEIAGDEPVRVALARFYEEDYICYSVGKNLTVTYGLIPSYKDNAEPDLSELKNLVKNAEYGVLPKTLSVSPDGEYLVATNDKRMMVTDLDSGQLSEYDSMSEKLRWFDASMMYAVQDGEVIVWDFDGQNKRNLADGIEEGKKLKVLDYAVTVTSNNRWIYYLTKNPNNQVLTLTRERIWG